MRFIHSPHLTSSYLNKSVPIIRENYSDSVLVNRYLRNPAGSGYVIPDVRIPSEGVIIDATIGYKDVNTPQVQKFFNYSPNTSTVIIVTPNQPQVYIPRPSPLGP